MGQSAARVLGPVMTLIGGAGFGLFEIVTIYRSISDSVFWAIFVFTPPGWVLAPFYMGTWLPFYLSVVVGLVGSVVISKSH